MRRYAVNNWRQGLAQEEVQSPSQSSTDLSTLQEKLKQSSSVSRLKNELASRVHEADQGMVRFSKTSFPGETEGDTWESLATGGGEESIVNLLLRLEFALKRFTAYLERAEGGQYGDNPDEQMRATGAYCVSSWRSQQTRG